MKKQSDVLKEAKAKIENPTHWIQGAYYQTIDGEQVETWSQADCFCSLGALRAANKQDSEFSLIGKGYLEKAMGTDADIYNDTHTHAEVLAMFDTAIKTAVRDEQSTEELDEVLVEVNARPLSLREEFEKEYTRRLDLREDYHDLDNYYSATTQAAWVAWQKSFELYSGK